MNFPRFIQTFGIMLLMGCGVCLIFAVAFTFLLGLAYAEGISAIIFLTVLTASGYYMFKYDETEKGELK